LSREAKLDIQLSVLIKRPVEKVFDFLSDFRNHHQEEKSQVLKVEKISPGEVGIGTKYREVVQFLPLVTVELISEIRRLDVNDYLEISWSGGGMEGVLSYRFFEQAGETKLEFIEKIHLKGIMRLMKPIVHSSFTNGMRNRLAGIRRVLEG
jgi:hypothetical protein